MWFSQKTSTLCKIFGFSEEFLTQTITIYIKPYQVATNYLQNSDLRLTLQDVLDANFANKSGQIPRSSLEQTIFCNCWHLKSFCVHSRHSVPSQSHFILILMFLKTTSDLFVNRAPGAGFFKTTLNKMSLSPVKPVKMFRLGLNKIVPSSILMTLASIFIESEKNSKKFKNKIKNKL